LLTDTTAPHRPPLDSKENSIGYSARENLSTSASCGFAAGFKGSKTEPRTPSSSIWNRFALHPAPHLLGLKEERCLKMWAGGMSRGCLWGTGRSGCRQPQAGSPAPRHSEETVALSLPALCPAAQHDPFLPGIYPPAWSPEASLVCWRHLCPGAMGSAALAS